MNEQETEAKSPPLSWFKDYIVDGQVRSVSISEEFQKLGNGEVGQRMNHWIRSKSILDSQTILEADRDNANKAMVKAEVFIAKITGFGAKEIWEHMVSLFQQRQTLQQSQQPHSTPASHSNGTSPK